MEDIICDLSAFNYYRTPPQVLIMLPSLPYSRDLSTRLVLYRNLLVENSLFIPVHFLVCNQNNLHGAETKRLKYHLWSKELPKGAVCDSDWVGQVTSPAFTLFTLARSLPFNQLVMAMYEMCGEFALYRPTEQMDGHLQEASSGLHLTRDFGWRRVKDTAGRATDLWRRAPLVELHELRSLAEDTKGLRGHKNFARALDCVSGVCLSPFEAQLSMLLSMPRCLGGQSIALENNKEIVFDAHARRIAGQSHCYVDVYLESPDHTKALAIECQGAMVHGSGEAALADADRTTALQSMGIEVMLLTYKQIASEERFAAVLAYISQALGVRLLPKSKHYLEAEAQLRRPIFDDWLALGK